MRSPVSLLELRRTEHYLVHDAIAQGGMASIHVGVREGALGFSRVVAVKRLHPQLASDRRFVAMLVDEARLVARIRHVNVVSTLDVLDVDGEVFVIMEFVKGASLARLMDLSYARDQLVPLEVASSIMVGALRGLHAAHDATDLEGAPLGIVHRDFSPQNVLVGVSGIPRVIDFGVARALGRADATRTGEFKGKLSYAAPEQLNDGPATRRTDVYSAGIVLWELLTGHRLFKGENDLQTFQKAARAAVRRPEEIFARDERLRAQRTEAQISAVGAVAMRALERDPDRRFGTAEEMALALEAACSPCRAIVAGAWVQSLARAELAAVEAVVMRAEEAMARRRRLASNPNLTGLNAAALEAPKPKADAPRPPPPRSIVMTMSGGLPLATFVAIALCAAAGAAIGATVFAALTTDHSTSKARAAPPITASP